MPSALSYGINHYLTNLEIDFHGPEEMEEKCCYLDLTKHFKESVYRLEEMEGMAMSMALESGRNSPTWKVFPGERKSSQLRFSFES